MLYGGSLAQHASRAADAQSTGRVGEREGEARRPMLRTARRGSFFTPHDKLIAEVEFPSERDGLDGTAEHERLGQGHRQPSRRGVLDEGNLLEPRHLR